MHEQSCISGSYPHPLKDKNPSSNSFPHPSQNLFRSRYPFGRGNRCSSTQPSVRCSTSDGARESRCACSHARLCAAASARLFSSAQGSLVASSVFVVLPLPRLTLPKWSVNMTQLIWGNLIAQAQPFKKHLRQHHGFYSIECQVTHNTDSGFCSMHLPVTLLHYRYFLYNLLQVRFHRNLFNCNHLTRFFMNGFEHTAIGTKEKILNKH